MKKTLIVLSIVAAGILLYKVREPELAQYNRHMCAVYGYYEDCKTPLPEELRLK